MTLIAQRHRDQIPHIKKKVEHACSYFYKNNERYHAIRRMVFESFLSTDELNKLDALKKPALEFNVLEAYISRLRGEFAEQVPSIDVQSNGENVDAQTVELVEGHLRAILNDANNDQFENEIYQDTLT